MHEDFDPAAYSAALDEARASTDHVVGEVAAMIRSGTPVSEVHVYLIHTFSAVMSPIHLAAALGVYMIDSALNQIIEEER